MVVCNTGLWAFPSRSSEKHFHAQVLFWALSLGNCHRILRCRELFRNIPSYFYGAQDSRLWHLLCDSAGEITQALPDVDLVLAWDGNLQVPGLVQICTQCPANGGCVASLRVILGTFSLEVCNLIDASTDSRGAALGLVIASTGSCSLTRCSCANAALCCPLFSSDHDAVEIKIAKAAVAIVEHFCNNLRRVASRLSPEKFSYASLWQSHFRDAAPAHAADFDASHFRRVQSRVPRSRAASCSP